MSTEEATRIEPSGICRMGFHEWRHEPRGGERLICGRCQSMSMTNYDGACRENCVDCNSSGAPGSR